MPLQEWQNMGEWEKEEWDGRNPGSLVRISFASEAGDWMRERELGDLVGVMKTKPLINQLLTTWDPEQSLSFPTLTALWDVSIYWTSPAAQFITNDAAVNKRFELQCLYLKKIPKNIANFVITFGTLKNNNIYMPIHYWVKCYSHGDPLTPLLLL